MNIDQLTSNIEARVQEVQGYQINIDNYSRMIAALPGEWTDGIAHYRGMDTAALVANIADDVLLTQVADLVFKDKLTSTLRTERLEQRKAMLVLQVLKDQLSE